MKRTHTLALAAMTAAAILTLASATAAIVYQQWDFRTAGPQHGTNPSCGVGVDGAGNSYLCGSLWRPGLGAVSIYTTKLDPNGNLSWTSYYNGAGLDNSVQDMVVDFQGNTYLAGTIEQASYDHDFITAKYSTAGQLLWSATYNGPTNHSDQATALAVDSSGCVYVTGNSAFTNSNMDFATIKYSPQGTQLWVARYSSPGFSDDEAADLAVDGDGNVYVTGKSNSVFGTGANYNIVTIKYNSLGQQQWVATYDGPAQQNDYPYALKVDAQGNVYVTGESENGSSVLITTLKYNSDGVQQWVANYNYEYDLTGSPNLALDTDGSAIVTASSVFAGNVLLKYNAEGLLQWMHTFGGNLMYSNFTAGIALDSNHNIYIAGAEGSYWIDRTSITYKYNSQGDLQWMVNYNPDACMEEGYAVALDGHGNVFVTGDFWWDNGDRHPLLVKYSQPAGNFTAAMVPTVTPVVIPAQGGSFSYTLQTFNTVQNNLATDFWWKVIYPPPSATTKTIGPVTMVLPLDSASFQRTQRVPGNIPTGIYKYILYAGDYPNFIWATDTILVVKTPTGDGPLVEGGWPLEDREQGEGNPVRAGREQASTIRFSANPNPFNPTTAISYKLQASSYVSMKVYDTAGRLVATLVEGGQEPGSHQVIFEGTSLPSGLYFYRLNTGANTSTGKMVLLK